MFLLFSIIFLLGVQSIQPMDAVSLSEQDIACLIDVNQKVISSSGPYTSHEIEALLKMNQLAVIALEKKLQNSQPITSLPEQDQDYRDALAFFNLNQQVSDQTRAFCNQSNLFPLQGSPDVSIFSGPTLLNTSAPTSATLILQSAPSFSEDTDSEDTENMVSEGYIQPLQRGKNNPPHALMKDNLLIEAHDEHGNRYQCVLCKKFLPDFTHAQRHSLTHLELSFKCDKCGYYAYEQHVLTQHMRHEHLTCCKETFASKAALALHRSTITRNHNLHIKAVIGKKKKNKIHSH